MRLSIVTPTLNAEAFLPELVESILSENSEQIEIEHIIVDAGSTDSTVAIAQGAGCRLLQDGDDGIFDAIDKGTRAATGDLVSFLGADDTLTPGASSAVANWYGSRTSDWAVGGIRWIDRNGESLGDIAAPPNWMTRGLYTSLRWNCVHHQSTWMTPEFYAKVGGFNPEYRFVGDYDFFSRALKISRFNRLPVTVATFRRHDANASDSGDPRIDEEYVRILERDGPHGSVQRRLYRELMRVWQNARNPRWFLHKKAPSFFTQSNGAS